MANAIKGIKLGGHSGGCASAFLFKIVGLRFGMDARAITLDIAPREWIDDASTRKLRTSMKFHLAGWSVRGLMT